MQKKDKPVNHVQTDISVDALMINEDVLASKSTDILESASIGEHKIDIKEVCSLLNIQSERVY